MAFVLLSPNPNFPLLPKPSLRPSPFPSRFLKPPLAASPARLRCFRPDGGLLEDGIDTRSGGGGNGEISLDSRVAVPDESVELESLGIWDQMKEIVRFAGPAVGLWICGPLMSLIDTAVIGQSSSLELAALGPGTVLCDYVSYLFMFLSISTSNMVATALAKKDKRLAQHQISILLFLAFSCGLGMLAFTKFFGTSLLRGFIGSENLHIVPASSKYVQIRGFAWPAILVGMVAQSASLGMKDSWGPLKALAVASAINGFGDIALCSFLGFGIAGAAWATMVSQVVAALMMVRALNKSDFTAFSITLPSATELLHIVELAAPVFVVMISKVAFYTLATYSATSMGTIIAAAHQVMVNIFCMCTVWAEPLSQTAQSFMPEMIHGVNRNLAKARTLLKSLVIIGALTGLVLGAVGTIVPWVFPRIFTTDDMVIREMHNVLVPYLAGLVITPAAQSIEGALLAGRDLKFLSLTTSACFTFGGLLLLLVCKNGGALRGCWWTVAGFQWVRFFLTLMRLTSPHGMLYKDDHHKSKYLMMKAS